MLTECLNLTVSVLQSDIISLISTRCLFTHLKGQFLNLSSVQNMEMHILTHYNSFTLAMWFILILLQCLLLLQLLRNRLVAAARKCMRNNASLGQVYGSMQEAYQQMQTPLIYQEPSAQV